MSKFHKFKKPGRSTSWQKVAGWYNKSVSDEASCHQSLIIPKTLELLKLENNSSLLDLGCGQGVLAKSILNSVYYQGIDLSGKLIDFAQKQDKNSLHHYAIFDVTRPLNLDKKDFTHAAIILALQNMERPQIAIENASKHLKVNGKMVVVLNHPCFRIPRQSFWELDEKNKIEYRRINRYLSPLKIPIKMHPGHDASPVTWSFHYSLSDFSKFLNNAGFTIEMIEEWVSGKLSQGKAARMENRARSEFPLFLTLLCRKLF